MDKLIVFVLSVTLLTFTIAIPPAFAEPVKNYLNGHYYEYIESPDISWTDANQKTGDLIYNGNIGHLATITSQSENDFVSGLITNNTYAWIGLTDENINGKYDWVNGDELTYVSSSHNYVNWDINQPEEFDNDEDYVYLSGHTNKWIDVSNDHAHPTGYIVEYSNPYSNIIKNPYNNHYYEYIEVGTISWDLANFLTEIFKFRSSVLPGNLNPHLVTIIDQNENDFVTSLIPDHSKVWIGLTDKHHEGNYKWINQEKTYYSNWSTDQHNDPDFYDYTMLDGADGKWYESVSLSPDISGFIIEYSPNYFIPEINPVYNPENGHYYQVVNTNSNALTWNDLNTFVPTFVFNGMHAHLATITDQEEDNFIRNLPGHGSQAWIGLSYDTYEEEFIWVTGEEFSYSNWRHNITPEEYDHGIYVSYGNRGTANWHGTDYESYNIYYYVIEFSP